MNLSADLHQFGVNALLRAYRGGALLPSSCIEVVLRRIEASTRPEAWIFRVAAPRLRTRAKELDALLAAEGPAVLDRLPLFGVPFAVKDNIDVAGLPTTAACPEFAYVPQRSAFAVDRLLEAGALLVGKTNLDQFATGLVGARSPYGAVRQVEFDQYIAGGSSSGSAVAVAADCVAFSLGTDTAGSGRVPAGLNGLVGLKPTRGLVSTRGVLPACRSLDCVSIFAHDVSDAWMVLQQLAAQDDEDPYSRAVPMGGIVPGKPRIGLIDTLEFCGDTLARDAFAAALERILPALAGSRVDVPFAPFAQTTALLYHGPWIAERRAALGAFFDDHPEAIHPVVREIIAQADGKSAVDAFSGQYELASLKRQVDTLFTRMDVLMVPTTPTHPTLAELEAQPIAVNTALGTYTNFVNLLDLAALSVPCCKRADGLPAGITLIGPAGSDHYLAVLGATIQALFFAPQEAEATIARQPLPFQESTVMLCVVGAHLRSQPLNWQLLAAGARFVEPTRTTADYRLYALAGTSPAKPGLIRVGPGERPGAAIDVELWELPTRTFGQFVADIPSPLGIGTVQLADGRQVKGFICEAAAVYSSAHLSPELASDITVHGGWLAHLAAQAANTPPVAQPGKAQAT